MKLEKVIAVTLYRRPGYTRQLLEALAACYGIADYRLLISCDYDKAHRDACDEVVGLARDFKACQTQVFVNDPRYGIDVNKLFILPKAFGLSDYVIFLEDDTIPSTDALRYFEWGGRRFAEEKHVISVAGYNRYTEIAVHQRVLAEQPYEVHCGGGFCPWGWAMWKDRYERIMGDGTEYAKRWGPEVNGRFDCWFCNMMHEPEVSTYPVLPRIQSVGGEQGEHTPSPEWHQAHEYNPYGAWSQPMPDVTDDPWVLGGGFLDV